MNIIVDVFPNVCTLYANKICLDFHTNVLLYSAFRIRATRSIFIIVIINCMPILTERNV